MADPTRARGPGDTSEEPFETRSPRRRALTITLLIAALLHAPFIPSRLWTGLQLYLLMQGSGEVEDGDDEVIIPIDLDLMKEDPSKAGEVTSPPPVPTAPQTDEAAADPTASAPKPPKPIPVVADAGADAAIDAPDDAPSDAPYDAPVDAPSDAPSDAPDDGDAAQAKAGADASDSLVPLLSADAGPDAEADAGLDAGPDAEADAGPIVASSDAGAPKVREPISQAGGPSQLAGKDPNVQILIAGDRIRGHPLGEGFGAILRSIPEWRGFFQDATIDPIKDLDHMLLAGPRFRGDSSMVVAVMDYNRPDKDIRAAVDGIVTRAKGEWLTDAPVPAARAKADRAERIFALVPEKNLLVILPAKEKDQLNKLKSLKAFNKSSPVAIVISMVTPSRPFKGIFKVPESFKWMRIGVTPTPDGGADVSIEAADASPEEAVKHAEELTSALEALRATFRFENPLPFGPKTIDVIDKTVFTADGSLVRASVHMSMRQLKGIMVFVEKSFQDRQAAPQKEKKP